jgi:LysM repeat protein
MKLFRLRRMPGSGEEEKDLVLDTDAEAQASAQDGTDAEVEPAAWTDTLAQAQVPAPEGVLMIHLDGEADNETKAEESAPASEPADIPIQDLLSDLVGVSRRLGIAPHTRTEPACDEARDASAEPDRDEALAVSAEPAEEEESAEPDGPAVLSAAEPSPTGYRHHVLLALFLSLALAAAVGGLIGAERLAHTEPIQRSPIIVATVPGIAPGLDGQPETTVEPTSEAAPEPTPEATPELQPAYFLYTVQPGDTVSSIAAFFTISPDYILWNNPDVIKDPNLVLAGEKLLIPSVDGIIYHVKPGDTLSDIAALYQIDVESILAFVPNGLTSPDAAIARMLLVLPGAVPPPPTSGPDQP